MNSTNATTRRAFRRTDDYEPNTPMIKLVTEPLCVPLDVTKVLIKVHAVALNYRDANMSRGKNPWPVTPFGIIGNDAAGEVVGVGTQVRDLKLGDRVAPNTDTKNITGREASRSWLAADEDGVLADYLVYDERVLCRLPEYLSWAQASIIPCAGVTAWSALKGAQMGQTILIQGTGGVAMFALKLAKAAGMKVVLSSSSDEKLQSVCKNFPDEPTILAINYATNREWHEDVLGHTGGVGVDIVLENGGPGTLLRSMKCTRRGGIISQVGYLDKEKFDDATEILPMLIDRRITLRGINAGSRNDMEDLCAALKVTRLGFEDIIDSTWAFDDAEKALKYLDEGKQVGKVVIQVS